MKNLSLTFCCGLALIANPPVVRAQSPAAQAPPQTAAPPPAPPAAVVAPPAAPPAADEAAIRKNAQAYDEAYNARNAKALAGLWSPDAIYADPDTGEEIVGREALEKYFTGVLADNDTQLKVDVSSVKFVSPNVAIEQGIAHVISANGKIEDSAYSAVHVRQGSQWSLDRVTEEGVIEPPKSNYEHLKELEWMVGSWIDQDEHATVETDVEWSKNKNFLTRTFAATIGDQIDLSGMQIIGWDPATKQIRSWVFDSDGGFGEARWSRKENRWTIQYSGTLPDGGKMSGANILTQFDDNAYGWESVNRELNGEILPNIDQVVIVRAPNDDEALNTSIDGAPIEPPSATPPPAAAPESSAKSPPAPATAPTAP